MASNDDQQVSGQTKPGGSDKKSKSVSKPKSDLKLKVAPSVKSATKTPAMSANAGKASSSQKPTSMSSIAKVVQPTINRAGSAVDGSKSGSAGSVVDARGIDGSNRDMRRTAFMAAAVVLGLLVVVLVVFGVLIYGYKSDNSAVKAVAQVIPYPVQRVNGHFVSYSDYLFEVDAEERAYESNAKLNNQPAPDFASASGQKLAKQIKQHALSKLESDAVVAQLASQMNVKVTDQQVDGPINQLYQQYGGKTALLKTLNSIYGWNLNDLKGVVRKQLLQQALQNKVTNDPAQKAEAKAKADNVLAQINAGGDFSTLAKKYSQASDASSGGNLGYFTKSQVPSDIYTAAESLKPGQVSGVITDQYGYVIVKVLDTKSDGSIDGQEILIETVDFNSYFQSQLNKAKVDSYIKV